MSRTGRRNGRRFCRMLEPPAAQVRCVSWKGALGRSQTTPAHDNPVSPPEACRSVPRCTPYCSGGDVPRSALHAPRWRIALDRMAMRSRSSEAEPTGWDADSGNDGERRCLVRRPPCKRLVDHPGGGPDVARRNRVTSHAAVARRDDRCSVGARTSGSRCGGGRGDSGAPGRQADIAGGESAEKRRGVLPAAVCVRHLSRHSAALT